MPVSTFLFYFGNLMLTAAYVVLAALSAPKGGVSGVGQMPGAQRALAVLFFGAGAVLHADMALHVIEQQPFFDHLRRISWDLTAIVFFEMTAVVAGLILILRARARRRRQR